MAKIGLALVLVLGIVGVAGAADVYTDEASFLAAIPGGMMMPLSRNSYCTPHLSHCPMSDW